MNKSSLSLATTQVVKMKANTADAPYVVEKGSLTDWQFTLAYATVDQFLVMAHEQLAASRLPYADRKEALQVSKNADAPGPQVLLICSAGAIFNRKVVLVRLSVCREHLNQKQPLVECVRPTSVLLLCYHRIRWSMVCISLASVSVQPVVFSPRIGYVITHA